ncbi:hypothetical protein PH210_23130 [Paenibacillus sp. BSR1-1]|uniref:hypothetical protein n=1 Tax=Paenibacillus sp. BSR1-1 TaxID=3020845 RepID=UPI0025B0EDCA|nr:hypothetical protein [Paenibacillus sp. BSR1-1]MDN3019070.1 hypothetical protein [Paenibacillus sp. BSR1-1]
MRTKTGPENRKLSSWSVHEDRTQSGRTENCPHGAFMRTKPKPENRKLSSWSVHEDKKQTGKPKAVFIEFMRKKPRLASPKPSPWCSTEL